MHSLVYRVFQMMLRKALVTFACVVMIVISGLGGARLIRQHRGKADTTSHVRTNSRVKKERNETRPNTKDDLENSHNPSSTSLNNDIFVDGSNEGRVPQQSQENNENGKENNSEAPSETAAPSFSLQPSFSASPSIKHHPSFAPSQDFTQSAQPSSSRTPTLQPSQVTSLPSSTSAPSALQSALPSTSSSPSSSSKPSSSSFPSSNDTPIDANLSSFPTPFVAAESSACIESLSWEALQGKKGIGMQLKPENWETNLPRILALNVSWNYSWGSKRIEQQPDDIEFIPMIWGAWGEDGVRRRLTEDIVPEWNAGRIKRYLSFNEPDIAKQSNLPVDTVIGYWPTLQEVNIPLATPSVGHPLGSWMKDFMARIEEECFRVEYTALHWYGNANANKFKSDMIEAFHLYGERPLLITEFAPADWQADTVEANRWSDAQVLNFMKEVLPWLERQPFVLGYAWFQFQRAIPAGTSSALFEDSTTSTNLTACGRYYASVNGVNPDGDQTITV